MGNADAITKVTIDHSIKEPPMYRVIYLNDNHTSMEFVIETLMDFFNYAPNTALEITKDIHELGSAIVAVLPFEIAEQKGIEVTLYAKSRNYPLQVKLEAEPN